MVRLKARKVKNKVIGPSSKAPKKSETSNKKVKVPMKKVVKAAIKVVFVQLMVRVVAITLLILMSDSYPWAIRMLKHLMEGEDG